MIITGSAPAAELRVLPAEIVLTGPKATHQLIVVREENGKVIADLTAKATFVSSNSAIATVDGDAILHPTNDGEAIITATVGDAKATSRVKVAKSREPFAWSFRNHVIPLFTKVGCNSGACHGALAGKGGFKLSLRGYAPEDDYFVLTRQARGRRVNRLEPSASLLLLKPTLALPHGGGQKLEVSSPDYNLPSGSPPALPVRATMTWPSSVSKCFPKKRFCIPRIRSKCSCVPGTATAIPPMSRVGANSAARSIWSPASMRTAWLTCPATARRPSA